MHIIVVRNNSNTKAVDASLFLATYLASQGIEYTLLDSSDLASVSGYEHLDVSSCGDVNLAVALGGDGTILRTARLVGYSGIPILGINFGNLGFLANSSEEGVVSIVAAALSGDVVAEKRTNLKIDVVCEGEVDPWADDVYSGERNCQDNDSLCNEFEEKKPGRGETKRNFFAFNEVAVTRGSRSRVIDFSLGISGSPIANMRGDGLVVSTATGSTAYALSAGGPLVAPSFTGLVVVPVSPHTLRSRALLTDASDVVEVGLEGMGKSYGATLVIDGESVEFNRPIARVYVSRGEAPTTLLRHKGESFYEHAAKVFF